MNRNIYFSILLISGILLFVLLLKGEKQTQFDASFAPFFQVMGKPVQKASKLLNKVIPVNEIDEKQYGEAIKEKFASKENDQINKKDLDYLQSLLDELAKKKNKPFEYKIFIMDSKMPNAFAMPGGALFITKGLLDILQSESELVAILGHEMGHVEKGHCFEKIRFELLSKKIGTETLGKIADITFGFFIGTSYNKTEEDEADEYAYQVLIDSEYDPSGEGKAFLRLKQSFPNLESRQANVVREYFLSHPYTEIRQEKFSEKAKSWWVLNQGERRYVGKQNYEERKTILEEKFDEEWISDFENK